MFDNLWFLLCFALPALAAVFVVGALTCFGWFLAVSQRPFRVTGSLVVLTLAVLCDSAALPNSFLGGKWFPMTSYGGNLEPFFYKWQLVSFVLILIALTLVMRDRKANRGVSWGTMTQIAIHCSAFLLFILLRFT